MMEMLLPTCLLLLGFVLLLKGADWLVDGSSEIARKFNISRMTIGLTIVAFGTSAPEFIVSFLASLNDAPSMSLGNILGSNIANVLLVLGVCAFYKPLQVKTQTVKREIPFMIIATLIFIFLAEDSLFRNHPAPDLISRIDGIALLILFAAFLFYSFTLSQSENVEIDHAETHQTKHPIPLTILGLLALIGGGHLIVENASQIAVFFGISEAVIGLTILALGTSLPELAASVVATKKGENDLAIGNVIGSVVFNTLWVIGFSATFKPMNVETSSQMDFFLNFFSLFLLLAFLKLTKDQALKRSHGFIFVVGYVVYILSLGLRSL
jgi:cation:H+ antiporter